jgi:hypothetical protein
MDGIFPVYKVHPGWGSDGGHRFGVLSPDFQNPLLANWDGRGKYYLKFVTITCVRRPEIEGRLT